MLHELQELYEYNAWANRRLLAAAARLTPEQLTREMGGSFPSVLETLVHILSAEWIWLSRWRGVSPTGWPAEWKITGHAALEARWGEVEREQAAFLSTLDEDALGRIIEYRNISGDPFAAPMSQMLRHVVNHSTYHRGQITHMLRQLGAETMATDLILFYRERERAAAVPA
jgi:uncharacterized damage-inducible protein DinB